MAKRYVAMGVKGGKAKPLHQREERMMESRERDQKKAAAEKKVKRAGKETAAHKVYGHLD